MLSNKFSYFKEVKAEKGDSWYILPTEKIREACKALRDNEGFECLSCLSGTDRVDLIEICYHLFSYAKKETLVLKIKAVKDGSVSSISDIYPSADWMERETSELLGVSFAGHKNLKKLLLPEDWIGYPLRKDYREPEEYCSMSTTRS